MLTAHRQMYLIIQVREVFDEFVKDNPNGKIKKSNFMKTMKKVRFNSYID